MQLLWNPQPSRRVAVAVLVAIVPLVVGGASISCALALGLERGELAEDEAGISRSEAGSDAPDAEDGGANAAQYVALVLAEGPLAYYPFEEPAATSVVGNRVPLPSPRARDGRVLGATLGAPGARGGADGAMVAGRAGARVELDWAGIPAGNAPFSIELAVRLDTVDPTPRSIVSHRDTADAAFVGYRMTATGAALVFERAEPSGTDTLRSGSTLQAGRWTHVAVTFDGARLRLLVGGAVVDELRSARGLPGTGALFVVGSKGDLDAPLLGRIDELAIYDRELAVEKVAAHAKLIPP